MKVLLLQDVKGSGKEGQIVNVNDGYARNYLFPKNLAVTADKASINAANIKKSALAHKKNVEAQKAKDLAGKVASLTITVQAKAGDNGKLFGSVTSKEIAEAIKAQHQIEIDKKKIVLPEPIKALGLQTVTAHVYEHTDVQFQVNVVALEQ